MIVKTFSGPSLRDALDNVRKAFGDDAVIIDTRFETPSGGRFPHRERGVHVTAAFEPEPTDQRSIEGPRSLTLKGELAHAQDPVVDEPQEQPDELDETTSDDQPEQDVTSQSNNIVDELIQRFSTVTVERPGTTENSALITWLAAQPRLAGEVIDAYATHVAESLPPFGPFLEREKSPLRVLFVGSRGAGRSNAMFKICAARWRSKQTQPGLIVVSDVPASGHEHLAAVCQRCGLQALIESTEKGRFSLPHPFKKSDLFAEFVPSSTDIDLDDHARSVHKSVRPDVVALVISATDSAAHWDRVIERFNAFKPTHVVVTHWDEHEPWTEIAAFARRHNLSVSYRVSGSDLFDEIDPFTESDIRNGIGSHVAETFAPKASTTLAKGVSR
ncbi:MAG: hypothetical protein GF341_03445 [candidate division Zixibacteria bacterium]|nr:hypothetical protein [candidate division Zixibacteria bacterium]